MKHMSTESYYTLDIFVIICFSLGNLFFHFRFLGHLYAAEALISLDRISDAITHLNPENVTDVSLGISSNEQDQG